MRITQRQFENIVILDLHGPMVGFTAADAVTDRMGLLRRAGIRHVVMSLSRVPTVDQTGLSALVDAYGAMRRDRGIFKLASVSARIDDLVVLTRLLTAFDTYDSVEEAVGGPVPAYADLATALPSSIALWAIPRFLRGA
jgi:anti-sigma B factor antagonist